MYIAHDVLQFPVWHSSGKYLGHKGMFPLTHAELFASK